VAFVNTRSGNAAQPFTTSILWYQASGAASAVRASDAGSAWTNTTTGWTQSPLISTSPSDAAFAALQATGTGLGAGHVHYMDKCGLFQFTPQPMAYCSLHSADPGVTGVSELSGGSPAYARLPVTWGAPSAGAMSNTVALVFNVPVASVYWVGIWDSLTGGTFLTESVALSPSVTFAAQTTLTFPTGSLVMSMTN
jgi:hypothetical protein